ncbi:MAG: esterase/lipase family protein [Janthinobacterium lividum]
MRTILLDILLILCCLDGSLPARSRAEGIQNGSSSVQAVPQQSPQPPGHPRVIVFVHGLHGDRESWRAANDAYWPDLVRTDPHFAYSDVVVAAYPSPSSGGKMSSVQLADTLWKSLRQNQVWDHREVVFVAHSLGGILVEEMLLRHPADAARVRFVVSYGTPHEGSTVARVASLYDKDPLLNDLSDAANNTFLTQLEDHWRSSASVNGIHRFCAYEGQDTVADEGLIRYLKPHTRVVGYFSATYGCDVTTPPQEIPADHIHMIKPVNRNAPAYAFFRRVYHDNPILEDQVLTRDSVIGGLEAGCNQTNANPDLQVPVALDSTLHEKVVSAAASLIDAVDVHDIFPDPPAVFKIDPNGVAHINYGFRGPGRKLLVCIGSAHASLEVHFSIARQVPVREPEN